MTNDSGGLLGQDFFPGEKSKEFSGDSLKLAEQLEQWVAEKISQQHQMSNESLLHRVSTLLCGLPIQYTGKILANSSCDFRFHNGASRYQKIG